MKFAAPYRPQITAGRLLRGQASALCTGPVDRHHVTLDLQARTGTGWVTRDQDTSNAIPYPQAVGLLVIIECRPGTWRLLYDVTASAAGETDHKSDASDTLTVTSIHDCQVPR